MERLNGVTAMKTMLAILAIMLIPHVLIGQDSPLTGASCSWDASAHITTVDLLRQVNLKQDNSFGTWSFEGKALIGGGDGPHSRLAVGPANAGLKKLPEEFNIVTTITRLAGNDCISLVFPSPGGGRGMVVLDWGKGMISGIAWVDKLGPENSGAGVHGALLLTGKPKTITAMIRKNGVVIQVDGKDYLGYRLDWSKVTAGGTADRPDQSGFSIFIMEKNKVSISKLLLTFPD